MKGIYIIKNIINNKVYIGQTVDIEGRLRRHKRELNDNRHHNEHLSRSWKKYGEDAFSFNLLEETEELNEREIYWISNYDSTNSEKGYNATHGGNSECPSEETKKKISKALKGKLKSEQHKQNLWQNRDRNINAFKGKYHSEETKQKISKGNKGKKHTEETKKKISESGKGRIFSEESRKKISESNKNRIFTGEHKQKISESLKGRTSAFKGKHHSEKTKQKISESGKGRKHTEEARKKISENNKGKTHSEEAKQKIRIANLGKKLNNEQKKSFWKANDELVIEVIKCLKDNMSVSSISKKLNVSRNFINGIKLNKTYTHINRDSI